MSQSGAPKLGLSRFKTLAAGLPLTGGRGSIRTKFILAVGATSAWTIIVARQISVTDQQTLALNVNYNATSVPAPTGFLPGNGAARGAAMPIAW